MREYEYEEILTGKDIVTEKIKESDIIGKKGWFSDNLQAVVDSIDHNTMPDFLLAGTLESTTYAGRFRRKEDREYYNFFIPWHEKTWIPFDLSKKEDRARLRGAWVREKSDGVESMITTLWPTSVVVEGYDAMDADDLLEAFEFIDGTPCGKALEVM